jgi:hypothetical protein
VTSWRRAYIPNKYRLFGIANINAVETSILARLAGGCFLPQLQKHWGAETKALTVIQEHLSLTKLAHAFVKYTSPAWRGASQLGS